MTRHLPEYKATGDEDGIRRLARIRLRPVSIEIRPSAAVGEGHRHTFVHSGKYG